MVVDSATNITSFWLDSDIEQCWLTWLGFSTDITKGKVLSLRFIGNSSLGTNMDLDIRSSVFEKQNWTLKNPQQYFPKFGSESKVYR